MPDLGFTGGGKLDMYLRRIAERAGAPQQVQVGFLAGSEYPDGTSVALVAWIQEFGAPSRGIPPRPFFRTMIAAHKDEWGDQLGKVLVAQDYNGFAALDLMGDVIAGELVESIDAVTAPALAAATVLRKGGGTEAELAKSRTAARALGIAGPDKPLIDTGVMRNSVRSEVTGG